MDTRLYVPSPVPDENGTVCNNAPGTHAAPCAVWCYSPARTVGAVPIELTFNGQVPPADTRVYICVHTCILVDDTGVEDAH